MFLAKSEGMQFWWVFVLVGIFALIGLVVFILRKKIPGLVNYEKEDEEKIAQDNLDRILVDVEDEKAEEETEEEQPSEDAKEEKKENEEE